jgi:hypothetical protein
MKSYVSFAVFLLSIGPINCLAQNSEINTLNEDAKRGSKSSIYSLGVIYSTGTGVKANMDIANKYYYESAIRNYSPAQNNLGWSFRQGLGVEKSPAKAVYWFRLAALQDNPLALQNLAEMYISGEGVPKRVDFAEDFYILCATQPFVSEDIGKEGGYNNAIHECRRELGKIFAVTKKDEQQALRTAAFWLRASLIDNYELKEDTETALRSRRAIKETTELLDKVNSKLNKQSKDAVENSLKNWNVFRVYVQDTTAFPLVQMDCVTSDKNL